VGRELRAGWSHTNPGEEHEHFAALWAAMEFRLRDGTWDVVLGPFRSTDDNGDLVSRAVGEMPPAVFEAWAAYAPETTHPLVRARWRTSAVARFGQALIDNLLEAARKAARAPAP
jgi:phage gp37-like protein